MRTIRAAALAALPLLLTLAALVVPRPAAAITPTREPVLADGTRLVIDLPAGQHMRNTGGIGPFGPGSGAGLCVFTAFEMMCRWHGVHEMDGFQEWMTRQPGGGTPDKLDAMVKAFCRVRGRTAPRYVQHTGGDEAFLTLLMDTRRAGCMTYAGLDDHYPDPIAHMVNVSHLDKANGAIIDNNRPGEFVGMTRAELLNRWKGLHDNGRPIYVPTVFGRMPLGGGWAVGLLAAPPPPGSDQAVKPRPSPTPVPKRPKCPGPNCPRWERVVYVSGEVVHKLYAADGQLLGVLEADGWHPAVSADGWSPTPSGRPPVALPGAEVRNFGVTFEQIDTSRCRYWVDGVEVDRRTAFVALADGDDFAPLLDDSDRYHLTVVVPDAKTRASVASAAAALAGIDRVHLQVYSAEDWAAARVKHPVTLQTPAKLGGRVVKTATTFDSAAIADVLKYADPDFTPTPEPAPAPRPKVDPAPTPPAPLPRCPNCPGPPLCPPPANPAPAPATPPPNEATAATDPTGDPAPTRAAGGGIFAIVVLFFSTFFRRQ